MRALLATDGSADANAAVDMLLGLGPESGILATVLAVAPNRPLLGADLEAPPGTEADDTPGVARAIVDDACERLRSAGHEAVPMVRHGDPDEVILSGADKVDAELIALGIRGVGRLRRLVAGSVATSVARLASVPVLLAHQPASLSTVLIAVDGSPGAERALDALRRLPASAIDRAVLLHVESGNAIAPTGHTEPIVESLRSAGVDVGQRNAQGNEVEEIVRVACEIAATLIVIGASQNQVDGQPLLGTTANGVINRAPCSILVGR